MTNRMSRREALGRVATGPTASDPLRVAQNPDGMLFVVRKAIPALRKIGVSDQAIRTMTVDVPKRYFEGA